MVRLADRLDMSLGVDWCVKLQSNNKHSLGWTVKTDEIEQRLRPQALVAYKKPPTLTR